MNMREMEKELKSIKRDIAYIKNNMIDPDAILSEDDYEALRKYRAQKKKGTLITHEQLKKELKRC
jgi:hypothetical protein